MSDRMNDVLAKIDAATAKCICGRDVPENGPSLDYCSDVCQYGYTARQVGASSELEGAWRYRHITPDGRTLNEQVARELEWTEPIGGHFADAMRADTRTPEPEGDRHWTAPDERSYDLVNVNGPTTRVEWIGDLTIGTRETIDLTSQIRSMSVSTSGLAEATQRLADALAGLGANAAEHVEEGDPGPVGGYEIRDGIDGPVVASGDFPSRADVERDVEARRREHLEPFLIRREFRWEIAWPEYSVPMSIEAFNRRLAELHAMGAIMPIPPSLATDEPPSAPEEFRRRALEHQQNRGTGPARRNNRRWRNR